MRALGLELQLTGSRPVPVTSQVSIGPPITVTTRTRRTECIAVGDQWSPKEAAVRESGFLLTKRTELYPREILASVCCSCWLGRFSGSMCSRNSIEPGLTTAGKKLRKKVEARVARVARWASAGFNTIGIAISYRGWRAPHIVGSLPSGSIKRPLGFELLTHSTPALFLFFSRLDSQPMDIGERPPDSVAS